MNERASADAERLEGARVNTCAAVMTSCTCEEVLSRLILDPVGSQGAALATSLNALVVGLFEGPTALWNGNLHNCDVFVQECRLRDGLT